MAKIAVAAIIEHNGRVLIGKKAETLGHFLSGKWHIPGGKVEDGEDEEQAVIREMHEEACITVKVDKFLDERFVENSDMIVKWFICSALTYDLRPGDDLEKVEFVQKSDVMKICDKAAIERWPPKVEKYLSN